MQRLDSAQHDGRVFVFDLDLLDLLVFVDGEVVVVGADFIDGDEEALVLAGTVLFGIQILPALYDVGDVVLSDRSSLVIQGETIGLHVIEPDLVRAASTGLGEHEDSGGNSGVGLEDSGRHGNDCLEPVLVDEFLPDGLVTGAVSEKNAVRNDGSATAAGLEHPHKEGQEKEFRLLGLGDGKEGLAHSLVVQAPREGRIGKAQGIAVLIRVVSGEAVPVGDVRIIDLPLL